MTWSGFLLSILGAFVAEELFGWSDRFCRWLVVRSARRLPVDLSDRYEQEWVRELAEFPKVSRVVFALGLIRAAYVLGHDARLPHVSPIAPVLVRGMDVILASWLLFLAAPLLLLASAGLKIGFGMRNPILDRDRRIGYQARPFDLLRFRTSVAGHNEISLIGRIVRAARIDELPQLLNVLRGDMSLVGPRAERPELAELLGSQVQQYSERYLARPGITGLAQINVPYGKSLEDFRSKLAQDREFIATYSLRRYLGILHRTIVIVLGRDFVGKGGRR